MNDLIKQQAVIDKLNEIQKGIIQTSECYTSTVELVEAIDYIQQEIYELPTVEAKPVVHCRDCCFLEVCKTSQWLGLDGYCSRGEKHD